MPQKSFKTIIIYDSLYGNTERIAKCIAGSIDGEVKVSLVGKLDISELKGIDLLIVGSPTHGGRPTPAIQKFLKDIPANSLKNVRVAAFDTRLSEKEQAVWLRLLIKVIDFAAPRIADALISKGGKLVVKPEGFIVEHKEGPLRKMEQERAGKWGEKIKQQ